MRLTLRTLLAYLDDRLSSANAKEIGQRINNSPFATELVERIRESKRRRRLAVPGKSAVLIDANLVAEYLDDQLTPELVARVEREILASDVLLAEVSSAHEILGLLREPVTVEPRLRDRLYALDPTGQTEVVRTLTAAGTHPKPATHAAPPRWTPLVSPPSPGRRFGIIAGALGLLWLIVIASDSGLFSSTESQKPTAVNEAADNANAGDALRNNADAPEVAANGAVDPAVNQPDDKAGGEQVADVDPAVSLVADAGEPGAKSVPENPNDAAMPVVDAPAGSDVPAVGNAVAATDPVVAPENKAPDAPAPPLPAAAIADVRMQADSRLVLFFHVMDQRWMTLAQVSGGDLVTLLPNMTNVRPLLQDSWFGTPDTTKASLTAADSGWMLTLLGRGLHRIPVSGFGGIETLDGRGILKVDSTVAWNADRLPAFELATGAAHVTLTLQTEGSWLAYDVVPIADPATVPGDSAEEMPIPSDADLHVRVMVIEGSVAAQVPGTAEPIIVPQGISLSWRVLNLTDFAELTQEPGPTPAAMPGWVLQPADDAADPLAELKEHLALAMLAPTEPADAVVPLLDDKNPQAAVMAVRALSQMRDSERLLTALFDAKDEAVQRAAIDALAAIITSSSVRQKEVRTSLETRLPMAEVEVTMNLLAGLSPTQIASPVVAAELMNGLASDRPMTRALAIYRMEQAVGDRMGFHPGADASRRREAIRRWERFIERNEGRLRK